MREPPPKTTAQWVQAALEAEQMSRRDRVFTGRNQDLGERELRAPLKETIISTLSRTMRVHSQGQRVIYSPRGETILVVEMPEGGNQIEHGDHLHAAIRAEAAVVVVGKAQS